MRRTKPAQTTLSAGKQADRERYAHQGDSEISITLTAAQVERVLRRGTAEASMIVALAGVLVEGVDEVRVAAVMSDPVFEDPRISQGLVLGLLVLASLPVDGSELGVKRVAALMGVAPSTAHRYLRTLTAVGLVEQNPRTRAYHLPMR
jgi:IclR helix-turn-helix domain